MFSYKKINTKEASNAGNEGCIRHTENSKMTEVSPSLPVITLNKNGLNSPIKRQDNQKQKKPQ